MAGHINTAFPEEKRPIMYKIMKWWGGKPHNMWSKYIEVYSQEGDIVLDPFCGRGVGAIESAKMGRSAIGVDLNPIAIFQSEMISANIEVEKIRKEWWNILWYESLTDDAPDTEDAFVQMCTVAGGSLVDQN